MLCNRRTPFIKKQGDCVLGKPKGLIGIKQLHTIFPAFQLKNEELGGAVAYGEILFHNHLLAGQFLVHLEEEGDDVGLGSVFGEAVGLQDGGVVGAVGLAELVGHKSYVV